MPSITLRPISGTGSNWTNIQNMYDNNNNSFASVETTTGNYYNRTATLNFDTSVIPDGSTINSAILHVWCKVDTGSSVEVNVDYNGSVQVFRASPWSHNDDRTSDITARMNSSTLRTLVVTAYNSSGAKRTTYISEIYIDVDYTEGTGIKKNIHLGDTLINKVYLGSTSIKNVYIGDKKVI